MPPITAPPSTSPWTSMVNKTTDVMVMAMVRVVTVSASGRNLRKDCSRISMPMMKSSISTPRSARVSIESDVSISPSPEGPSATPTRMKPAAAGSAHAAHGEAQRHGGGEDEGNRGDVFDVHSASSSEAVGH